MIKKRICVVTTKSSTLKSFLIGQLEYLSRNGYDVTVVCDTDDELAQSLPEWIQYKPIPMKRGIDGFGSLRSIWNLYRLFKSGKYDIVQYSTPNAACYSSIASWIAGIPIRLYCQWGIRYVGFHGWKRKLYKMIEKMTCSLSTHVEPDSEGNLRFSRHEGLYTSDKSRVIWHGSANGVDLKKFDISQKEQWRKQIHQKYGLGNKDFIFGFIGRIEKDKGINELLSAFRTVVQSFDDVKLLIVGPYDKKPGINQELITWSEECASVIYCGYVTEVEKHISAMDVFILPSYREGFGSVVVEAEAMGVPVIVTDIPGPTDAMQDGITGLVVPKATVEPLVEAMENMRLNAAMRQEMGHKAIHFAQTRYEQATLWTYILEDRDSLIHQLRPEDKGVMVKYESENT